MKNKSPAVTQVERLTALWAFSEAVLGGILHAFKIPVTGLFLGSFAVVVISLIFYYSKNPRQILKSTFIVVLVKFIVSPYTPITAYFAVFVQGFLGFLFFYFKVFYKTASILLGITAVTLSGIQKLIIYTLLFGFTFWKSINLFYQYLLDKFLSNPGNLMNIDLSLLIVSLYLSIHIIVGFFAGFVAGKLPSWIETYYSELKDRLSLDSSAILKIPPKGKKKAWWERKSTIILFLFFFAILLLSYTNPDLGKNHFTQIIIMVIRAFFILFLWLKVLLPVINKLFKKYLEDRENKYSDEVHEIISQFPQFKLIVSESWKISGSQKGLNKLKCFFSIIFIFLLKYEFE
ncbi:hypothetical protein BMS3Abin04_01930 [bacterium BMS3Abin04]|nr:hypothetical protein BMS3Abin04_01930 [bacterium BMS3Abin04]